MLQEQERICLGPKWEVMIWGKDFVGQWIYEYILFVLSLGATTSFYFLLVWNWLQQLSTFELRFLPTVFPLLDFHDMIKCCMNKKAAYWLLDLLNVAGGISHGLSKAFQCCSCRINIFIRLQCEAKCKALTFEGGLCCGQVSNCYLVHMVGYAWVLGGMSWTWTGADNCPHFTANWSH